MRNDEIQWMDTDNVRENCNTDWYTVESDYAYKKDCKVHVRKPGDGYLD